jgi:iron complex transport system permease protein
MILLLRGSSYNTLGLGDDVAASSGVGVHWLRAETFIVAALITSAAVALAGPIGFVGLIVPHVCRMIFGPDHRKLAVISGMAGAIFLMVADTLCRTVGPLLSGGEIPVGVLTALSGGPFFIVLLRRRTGQARL